MAMRTRLAGVLSRGLLATATVGIVAVLAACGSVRAGPGSHPGTAGGSAVPAASGTAPGASGTAPAASSTGSAASSAPASAAVALCADAARLDRMVASLSAGFIPGHFRVMQPAGVTITDPARVRAVAVAVCRLPLMTSTHMGCPDIHGAAYRLTFSAAGRMFPPVMVAAGGCLRPVYGLGPARLATAPFLDLLRRELSLGPVAAAPVPIAA